MAMPNDEEHKSVIDRRYAEGRGGYTATSLQDAEQQQAGISGGDSAHSSTDDIENVRRQEEGTQGVSSNGFYNQSKGPKKENFFKRLTHNKKMLAGVSVGGGLSALFIAAFLALIPLKLEMFVQNITKQAAAVPAEAVENRMQYLVTRALATQMLMAANSNMTEAEGKLVFCENAGSIACSLFATWQADYFERKLGITMNVEANGRVRLGAKATSWTIKEPIDTSSGDVDHIVREINKNSEMKAYIRQSVNDNTKSRQIITRFLARRILMKKYGVTHWRGFESTSNKIDDMRASFSANMYKNTVGKVSGRMTLYLACLSGGSTCKKLLATYKESAENTKKEKDPNDIEYKRAEKHQEIITKIENGLNGVASENSTQLSKVISKKVLQSAGGALAGVGLLDLVFSGVGAIDEGALEQIANDINKTAYIGLAFGDGSGLVVNNDKMKAGDIDINTLALATSLMDDAEKSPLMQAENGISTATATTQVARECSAPEGYKQTTLAPGELVCPENKLVRDYTSMFTSNSAWATLATVADGWNESIGKIIDLAGEAFAKLFGGLPFVQQAMAALSVALEPLLSWFVDLIFDIPNIGLDAPGANNYDAMSGGIRVSQNELMEQGVAPDGKAYGGGGTVLSNDQIATIQRADQAEDAEYYAKQPILAKIFNPSLSGSFAQRMAVAMPTSFSSLATLPSRSFQSVLSPSTAGAVDGVGTVNPFNLPIYGYASGDPILEADPSTYVPDYCQATAKAREDSLAIHPELSRIPTYSVADPCALEKMVVGTALAAEGITNDQYSLPELQAEGSANVAGSLVNSGNIKDNGWAWPAPKGTTACGFDCYAGHTGMDIAMPEGSDIYAARDGVVTWAGPDQYMNSAACYAATGGKAPFNGTQYTVIVRHQINGGRVDTLYTHLQSGGIKVKVGDSVKAGDFIAKSGNTGCSTGAHLHFGVYIGGFANNPVDATTILGRSG